MSAPLILESHGSPPPGEDLPVDALSAALAHEWHGALAPIKAAAQCLESATSGVEEIQPLVRLIVEEVERLSCLAEGILQCFKAAPSPRLVNLNRLLDSVVQAAEVQWHDGCIKFEMGVEDGLPDVWADEVLIRRVLMNLVNNACQAIGAGPGTVRLAASFCRSESLAEAKGKQFNQQATSRLEQDDSVERGFVRLSVEDSGSGIPEGFEASVFDPRFTTKQDGTGLGLAISRSIVRAHGGEIHLERSELGGCAFVILLPFGERGNPQRGGGLVS
jgi:nitrogen-specific signal transduction histidine kinase